MKPKELFREAMSSVFIDSKVGLVASPERIRYEEAMEAFQIRAGKLMDQAQSRYEGDPHSLDYSESQREKPEGDGVLRITRRVIQFSIEAEEEFNQFVDSDAHISEWVLVGTHDLEFIKHNKLGEEQWTSHNKAASCDVVTVLVVDPHIPNAFFDNPFENFMVLERSNWQHPVFEVDTTLESGAWLDPEVEHRARQRVDEQGWEANLGGIHSTLDGLEDFLRGRR